MHPPNRSADKGKLGSSEKRSFERFAGEGTHDAAPEEKRQKIPALASVIVEAVKMDSLQKLCSSLEPILRRVVGEEVERALARLVPNRLGVRALPSRQLSDSSASNLRLLFRTKLALPLFTGGKIEGDQALPIHVVLEDASTGQVVTRGAEASAKLEVVVLDGDFNIEDDEGWTADDFENHVVKERDGKRPLLTGDLALTLKEGVGTLGELTFTDNSSWIRCRKFRLGVRVATGFCEGVRIQECKTDAFTVKDHRGELYKKHYPPALSDEVWRLDKIGKDGAFHKRLNINGIKTVEEFLRSYVMDQQKLRSILGGGMSNRMWEATVDHAKTCVLSGKLYIYYAEDSHNIGVLFNNIYELMGISTNGHYKSVDSLTETEKVYVDKLVKAAYDNWTSVTEYDNDALVSDNSYKSGAMYGQGEGQRAGGSMSSQEQQPTMYNQQMILPSQGRLISNSSSSNYPNPTAGSDQYSFEGEVGYTTQDHLLIQNNQIFTPGKIATNQSSALPMQSSFPRNAASVTGLALGPSQSLIPRPFGFPHQPLQPSSAEWVHTRLADPSTPAVQVDHYFTEEAIQAKSLELLGNDDLQQAFRLHYSALPENFHLHREDGYTFPVFSPSPGVSEDGVRTSGGKAYVGWLKLKAALRWGIFIRKIAAEKAVKRAQLEELED